MSRRAVELPAAGPLTVSVSPSWRRSRCGACGQRAPRYDRQPFRTWRHLSWGRIPACLKIGTSSTTTAATCIIARTTPEGYDEISRTHLIDPTSAPGNRRELKTVNWSHPAYANRRIYARNDEEIIAASLAAPD